MRFISTSATTVESLKKQAKKLQRKVGGKHTDALDRVARSAGYNHWHHVTLCLKEASTKSSFESLQAECELVIKAALDGVTNLIMTGPEVLARPLILFASEGDAWMLEPEENLALCLMFHGERQSLKINDLPTRIEIQWDGTFELAGDFFKVETDHPAIGRRAIGGFPLDELRKLIDRAQSVERRIDSVILQTDAIDITPEIVSELVKAGWNESDLIKAASDGARYSPSRNSLLFPAVTNEDL